MKMKLRKKEKRKKENENKNSITYINTNKEQIFIHTHRWPIERGHLRKIERTKRRVSIRKVVERYVKQTWRVSITSEIESNGEVEIQGSIALLFAVLMAELMAGPLQKCSPRERQLSLKFLDLFASGSSLSLRPRERSNSDNVVSMTLRPVRGEQIHRVCVS